MSVDEAQGDDQTRRVQVSRPSTARTATDAIRPLAIAIVPGTAGSPQPSTTVSPTNDQVDDRRTVLRAANPDKQRQPGACEPT